MDSLVKKINICDKPARDYVTKPFKNGTKYRKQQMKSSLDYIETQSRFERKSANVAEGDNEFDDTF